MYDSGTEIYLIVWTGKSGRSGDEKFMTALTQGNNFCKVSRNDFYQECAMQVVAEASCQVF